MIYWRLSATLTACLCVDRVIFLDLDGDRYAAAPDALTDHLVAWFTRPDAVELSGPAAVLIKSLAGAQPFLAPCACPVAMPAPVDAEPIARHRFRTSELFGVTAAARSAARDIRNEPIARVLSRRFPLSGTVTDREKQRARLAAFRMLRPFVPVPRVCLHDCLALLAWLGRSAGSAQLFFGVSAYPFAAHSWVQDEGRVIDDHPESPSRFTPILHFG